MKKTVTLILFLFPLLLHSSDKVIIDYNSYLFPAKTNMNEYQSEHSYYTEIIDKISWKTGVELNIYQNINQKLSSEEKAEAFITELQKELYSNPPDLVHFPYTRWDKWKSFVATGDFVQVDELIKQHAPNLYQSYPSQFWAYRKEKGNDQTAYMDYKPQLEILYENLMKCNDYNRDLGLKGRENYLLSFFHWKESVKSWFRLQDAIPLGIGEILYISGMNQVVPLFLGDIDVERYKKFQHKLQNGFFKGRYVYDFFWNRWKIAYIPYHQIFSQNYRWKTLLPEIFSSKEYIYISPRFESGMVVFDTYDELYIPAGSDVIVDTIKFIDTIYGQKSWYDIFMFGTENFETDESNEYGYDDVSLVTQNRSNLFSPLQVLCNKGFTRIPAFYPAEIKKIMHEYFEAEEKSFNEPLYGFDISSAYHEIPHYFESRESNLIDSLTKLHESNAYISVLRTAVDYLNGGLKRYIK